MIMWVEILDDGTLEPLAGTIGLDGGEVKHESRDCTDKVGI